MNNERKVAGEWIACAHQPAFLPWLGFFAKATVCDVLIVMDQVQFTRRNWINRVRVGGGLPPNWLTVPVRRPARRGTPIREIEIDYSSHWVRKHQNALQCRYGRCPEYKAVVPEILACLEKSPRFLFDLNMALLTAIFGLLELKTRFVIGSGLKAKGSKSELIARMCSEIGATSYVAGQGAIVYEDISAYTCRAITYHRSKFCHLEYRQHSPTSFQSGLSIVDALFNLGAAGTRALLSRGHCDEELSTTDRGLPRLVIAQAWD